MSKSTSYSSFEQSKAWRERAIPSSRAITKPSVSLFRLSLGPAFLVGGILIAFFNTSLAHQGAAWLSLLCLSQLLSLSICYFSFHEAFSKQGELLPLKEALEQKIALERSLHSKEHALLELTQGYETLFEENTVLKEKEVGLMTSLEEALEEIREKRAEQFIKLQHKEKEEESALFQELKQLRVQFEEKAEMLNETHKKLFEAQTEAGLLEKMLETYEESSLGEEEHYLEKLQEFSALEEQFCIEIALLEEIVTSSYEKRQSRSSASKKKPENLEFEF